MKKYNQQQQKTSTIKIQTFITILTLLLCEAGQASDKTAFCQTVKQQKNQGNKPENLLKESNKQGFEGIGPCPSSNIQKIETWLNKRTISWDDDPHKWFLLGKDSRNNYIEKDNVVIYSNTNQVVEDPIDELPKGFKVYQKTPDKNKIKWFDILNVSCIMAKEILLNGDFISSQAEFNYIKNNMISKDEDLVIDIRNRTINLINKNRFPMKKAEIDKKSDKYGLFLFKKHSYGVLKFSLKDKYIVTTKMIKNNKYKTFLYEAETFKLLDIIPGRLPRFSANEKYLATKDSKKVHHLYDLENLSHIKTVKGLYSFFSRDSKYFATKMFEETYLYKLENFSHIKTINAKFSCFSPDSKHFLLYDDSLANLLVYDLEKLSCIKKIKGKSSKFSSDNKYLITTTKNGNELFLYNAQTFKLISTNNLPRNTIFESFSPNGKYTIFYQRNSNQTLFFCLDNPNCSEYVDGYLCRFSRNSKYLIMKKGLYEKYFYLYDARTFKYIKKIKSDSLSFSPDGKYLAKSEDDSCKVCLYNAETFNLIKKMKGLLCRFTLGGNCLYSNSYIYTAYQKIKTSPRVSNGKFNPLNLSLYREKKLPFKIDEKESIWEPLITYKIFQQIKDKHCVIVDLLIASGLYIREWFDLPCNLENYKNGRLSSRCLSIRQRYIALFLMQKKYLSQGIDNSTQTVLKTLPFGIETMIIAFSHPYRYNLELAKGEAFEDDPCGMKGALPKRKLTARPDQWVGTNLFIGAFIACNKLIALNPFG